MEKKAQAVNLLHLKGNIKAHLGTKVHLLKKEVMETKEAVDEQRQGRRRKVGMNVFRERYMGLKQVKHS